MDPIPNDSVFIVDSWPLLEKARHGTNLPRLERLFDLASGGGNLRLLMSEVNLGEFFYLTSRAFGPAAAEIALQHVYKLPIEILPISPGDGMLAARLKARFPISYADCFCANLAIAHDAAVLTGDPDFLKLQAAGLLTVEWLGA